MCCWLVHLNFCEVRVQGRWISFPDTVMFVVPAPAFFVTRYVGAHGHTKVEPHALRSEVLERMQMVDGFTSRCVCLYLFFRSFVYEEDFVRWNL
jgi:hypothetical protein